MVRFFYFYVCVSIVVIPLILDSFEENIKFKTSRFDPNMHDVIKKFDGFVEEHIRICELASTDEETDLEEDRKGKQQSEYIFCFQISQNFASHFLSQIFCAAKHSKL